MGAGADVEYRCVGKGGQSIYGKPFADEVRGTIKVS
jgi:hypothetical protein